MDRRDAGDDVWTGDSGDSNAKVIPRSYMEQLVLGIGMSTSYSEKDIACEPVRTEGWTSPTSCETLG